MLYGQREQVQEVRASCEVSIGGCEWCDNRTTCWALLTVCAYLPYTFRQMQE